ncbi:alpha/beta superfamily hydrolase [Pyronema domesticum]|uniref:Similar to Abhydrolase domain-containing protein 13 acc. no. Q6IRP4 n=1 Tax=Pyronema omphalodes (strain CBS 100304) TaxID=1076935 RepID=U4KU20_PYROM|nr:alpha/beta superfamily hydrolase [Pyronema domesticum]CCX04362.1 Similar to Abhydrolase domain-containing protein 13; acc. no. Q6IRP4 [Pyronema omphalodes CBS 100304]
MFRAFRALPRITQHVRIYNSPHLQHQHLASRYPILIDGLQLLRSHGRHFSLSSIHPVILAPLVFVGLTLTLWSYKCLMMVLFQSRIIYMPSIPPGARREKISDYAAYCRGIQWTEGILTTSDRKTLATASATVGGSSNADNGNQKEFVIVYFQGNASSTPPRLPELSSVLSRLSSSPAKTTLLIPSYRGYWNSTGSPSQRGIEKDLVAIFSHLNDAYPTADIILWGQSIGCGISVHGLAEAPVALQKRVKGVLLETPFVSIRNMLVAVYPQKWLPYRYLGRFLWNTWELVVALEKAIKAGWNGRVLIMQAGADELVPEGQAGKILEVVEKAGLQGELEVVRKALHVECLTKPGGMPRVVGWLHELLMEKKEACKNGEMRRDGKTK